MVVRVLILLIAGLESVGALLCWRHTVPKLTPDGHTNVDIRISREVGPELGQKPKTITMPEQFHRRLFDGSTCTHKLFARSRCVYDQSRI